MKMFATAVVVLAFSAATCATASASNCSWALSKGGAKAFYACLDRDRG
jgi:hypothetical protein